MFDELALLDEAKALTGSDSETARRLGLARQRIDNIRRGHNHMSPWMAGKLAEVVGKDGAATAFYVMAENAKNPKEKSDWRRWSGVAAVCVMISAICATALPSTAYAMERGSSLYYVKYALRL